MDLAGRPRFLDVDFDADLRLDLDLPLSERGFLDFDLDLALDLRFDADLRLDLDFDLLFDFLTDFEATTLAPLDGYITVRCVGPVFTAFADLVSATKNPPLFFLPTAKAGSLVPVGFPEASTTS